MPKVSIVVPVYNVEKYLDRCVQSLLNQTLEEIEIILVDDGSPDNCPQLCDDYACKDSRVQVIHKQNAGLGMACNSGLEIATGEFIAFCDSDDWVDRDMYETMYKSALKYNADMVMSGIRIVYQDGKESIMSHFESFAVISDKADIEHFALGIIANPPSILQERETQMSAKTVLYNNKLLQKHAIRFESERELITEDLFFNLDCFQKSETIVCLPNVFYNYFVNTTSISRAIRTDRFHKIKIVLHELLSRYNFASEEFKTRCLRLFIGYSRVAICQIAQTDQSFKEKYTLVKQICNDSIWSNIRNEYPVNSMPKLHKLFQNFILHKWYVMLLFLAKVKNMK